MDKKQLVNYRPAAFVAPEKLNVIRARASWMASLAGRAEILPCLCA